MLSRVYKIIIGCGVGAPGHGKYAVYDLNTNNKRFIKMLTTNVQLAGESTNNSPMSIHAAISNTCISLAMVFQKHLSEPTRAHGLIYHRKYRKQASTCK